VYRIVNASTAEALDTFDHTPAPMGHPGVDLDHATLAASIGWVWKQAQLVARDDNPERNEKLARIRHTLETLGRPAIMLFADEFDIHLLPRVGYHRLSMDAPGGGGQARDAGAEPETLSGWSPGTDNWTDTTLHGLSEDERALPGVAGQFGETVPKARFDHVSMVVGNHGIHKAKAVERRLGAHPRFMLLLLPTYDPKANSIERAFGDVPPTCPRNHQCKRIEKLVGEVAQHWSTNGSLAIPTLTTVLHSGGDNRNRAYRQDRQLL